MSGLPKGGERKSGLPKGGEMKGLGSETVVSELTYDKEDRIQELLEDLRKTDAQIIDNGDELESTLDGIRTTFTKALGDFSSHTLAAPEKYSKGLVALDEKRRGIKGELGDLLKKREGFYKRKRESGPPPGRFSSEEQEIEDRDDEKRKQKKVIFNEVDDQGTSTPTDTGLQTPESPMPQRDVPRGSRVGSVSPPRSAPPCATRDARDPYDASSRGDHRRDATFPQT